MNITYPPSNPNLPPNLPIEPKRSVWRAMRYGACLRCPSCGIGPIFSSYLKVRDKCPNCHEELHHHRADDAPPYFTIFIVGHIVIPIILAVELNLTPPIWLHLTLWLPMTVILSLLLLPVIKGMTIAAQWSMFMHGFGNGDDYDDSNI